MKCCPYQIYTYNSTASSQSRHAYSKREMKKISENFHKFNEMTEQYKNNIGIKCDWIMEIKTTAKEQ
jgi:hypothetical protein